MLTTCYTKVHIHSNLKGAVACECYSTQQRKNGHDIPKKRKLTFFSTPDLKPKNIFEIVMNNFRMYHAWVSRNSIESLYKSEWQPKYIFDKRQFFRGINFFAKQNSNVHVRRGEGTVKKEKGGITRDIWQMANIQIFRLIQNLFFDKKVNPNQKLPQKVPNISRTTYVQY